MPAISTASWDVHLGAVLVASGLGCLCPPPTGHCLRVAPAGRCVLAFLAPCQVRKLASVARERPLKRNAGAQTGVGWGAPGHPSPVPSSAASLALTFPFHLCQVI